MSCINVYRCTIIIMHLDMSRNYISKKVKMTSNVEYMKHYFVNKHLEDLEKTKYY